VIKNIRLANGFSFIHSATIC